jgi:hypothetical protein
MKKTKSDRLVGVRDSGSAVEQSNLKSIGKSKSRANLVFGVNEALWQVEWVSWVGRSIQIVRFVPRGRSLRCLGLGEDSTWKLVPAIAQLRRGRDGIFG